MFSISKRHLWMSAGLFALFCRIDVADAQLTDLTQTPNAENAGIFKSLEQQIGTRRRQYQHAGILDLHHGTATRHVPLRRGRQLFQRKFTLVAGLRPAHAGRYRQY